MTGTNRIRHLQQLSSGGTSRGNRPNDNNIKEREHMKKVALYIRVSTEEQARHGLSVAEQEKSLRDYAQKHKYSIVGVYRDEGISARKNLNKRKALQELMTAVKAGRVDIILFIKLDRWSRSTKDYYKIQEVLDCYGVDWIATQEDYNTTTTNGKLMLNMKLAIAQNEADTTADRINFVKEGKLARREAICGNLPVGYKIENKKIVIDTPQAEKVCKIFEYYLQVQNTTRTVLFARELGINFKRISCRRMLANESYIGTFYGIENYAEPIISTALFYKTQEVLEQKRRTGSPKKKSPNIFLFSGLIKCPICSHILIGNRGYKYKGQTEYKNKLYRCPEHNIERTCSFTGTIFQNTLEKYLLDNLQELIEKYIAEQKRLASSENYRKSLQRSEDIKQGLSRIAELYAEGFIDKAEYIKRYNAYTDEQTQLTHDMQKALPIAESLKDLIDTDVKEIYSQLSEQGKADFWHSIIKSVYITSYTPGRGAEKTFNIDFL